MTKIFLIIFTVNTHILGILKAKIILEIIKYGHIIKTIQLQHLASGHVTYFTSNICYFSTCRPRSPLHSSCMFSSSFCILAAPPEFRVDYLLQRNLLNCHFSNPVLSSKNRIYNKGSKLIKKRRHENKSCEEARGSILRSCPSVMCHQFGSNTLLEKFFKNKI